MPMFSTSVFRWWWFGSALWLSVSAPALLAQLPVARLSTVFPPGGTTGSKVEVTVTGVDLDDATHLYFSQPDLSATQKLAEATGQPEPNKFVVTIASNATLGRCEARVVGRFGISNPRFFEIGTLPETIEKPPNTSFDKAAEVSLGSIVNGRSEANSADYFKFTASKGQRVLISCAARAIDSRMDATLTLFDAAGRELERNRRGGLLDFKAQTDGAYVLKVHDFLYRGGEEYFYRLTIGTGPHLDFVFPPSGLPGTKAQFVLFGRNLPGGSPVPNESIDGKPLEQLTVEIELPGDPASRQRLATSLPIKPSESAIDGFEHRLTTPQGVSNPVLLGFATGPVVPEQAANDKPSEAQKISPPCEVVGQFHPAADQDWFTFEAKKGDVYWVEILSQRLGLPTDPFAVIQRVTKNDKGEEQAGDVQELSDSDTNIGGAEYNTATRDPAARFEAKEDGTCRVQIRDLFGRTQSSPHHVYRLSMHKETPDFRLVALVPPTPPPNKDVREAKTWSLFLRRGETWPVKVMALRRDGFSGEIQLSLEGAPPGVSCANAKIDANQNAVSLLLSAAENVGGWTGPLKIVGKAKVGETELVREARAGAVTWNVADYNTEAVQSRMTREFVLSTSGREGVPISIAPVEHKIWEAPATGKVSIPITLARRGEFNGKVKLKPAGLAALDAAKEIEVDGKATNATVELDLAQLKVPAGNYSFYLHATTPDKYRRLTPDEVKPAEELAQAEEKTSKQAEAAAADLAAKAKQAAEALAASVKAVAEAEAAAKTAAEKLAAAKAALEKSPANAELTAARAAAEKEAEAEAAKARSASEAKAAAEKTSSEAASQSKEAEARKAAAASRAKAAAEKLQLKDVSATLYSSVINLKVTAAEPAKSK